MKSFALTILTLVVVSPIHAITVSFTPTTVTASGIAPGSEIAWMAELVEPYNSTVSRRWIRGVAVDDDFDGTITLTPEGSVPEASMWVVASLVDGSYVVDSPRRDLVVRLDLPNLGSPHGPPRIDRNWITGLMVRPGEGAWVFELTDGGPRDADRIFDGRLTLEHSSFEPLGQSTPRQSNGLRGGDLFVILDWDTLEHAIFAVGR